jgi:S1-C subfamily serine protease
MSKRFVIAAAIGCAALILLLIIAVPVAFLLPIRAGRVTQATQISFQEVVTPNPAARETQQVVPTFTAGPEPGGVPGVTPAKGAQQILPSLQDTALVELFKQVDPGVVNIQIVVQQQGTAVGQGAGSGFIIDDQGHIVTNNHVVAQAQRVTAIFYNGIEASAEIVGTDADSDLAVIKVDQIPEGAHPLVLGDSDQVKVGEWVVAIGNPFGLGSSMSAGIVSATGRTIPTQLTQFSIPQAIQTDAAVNPGNSGGPLIDLGGRVVGVNAQIATGGGTPANAGVAFAIPSNIVRRVVPVLIKAGSYQWPWLGVEGGSVNLLIQQANNLPTQQGAYIDQVVPGGPAAQAGLQGSTGTETIDGIDVPVGGDVVIKANGEQITDFNDLLVRIAFSEIGTKVQLTILRGGEEQAVTLTLQARPSGFTR